MSLRKLLSKHYSYDSETREYSENKTNDLAFCYPKYPKARKASGYLKIVLQEFKVIVITKPHFGLNKYADHLKYVTR